MYRVWPDGWYYYDEQGRRWIRFDGQWIRTDWDVMAGHAGQPIEGL